MSVINGTSMLVYSGSAAAGWTPIATATSHTLNISMTSRDTSNKTTGKFVDRAAGRVDVTGTCEGFATHETGWGYEKLMDLVIERQEVMLLFADVTSETDSTPNTGSEFYSSGSFFFTSFDLSAPQEDNAAYTANFELAGEFGLFNK